MDCEKNKATRSTFKSVHTVSTSRPLQLLHMDLFGSSRVTSLCGKLYAFVIIDDFLRFTWVYVFVNKSEALFANMFKTKKKSFMITQIRSDNGREFENAYFKSFCNFFYRSESEVSSLWVR